MICFAVEQRNERFPAEVRQRSTALRRTGTQVALHPSGSAQGPRDRARTREQRVPVRTESQGNHQPGGCYHIYFYCFIFPSPLFRTYLVELSLRFLRLYDTPLKDARLAPDGIDT